jgi:hypothetical protein
MPRIIKLLLVPAVASILLASAMANPSVASTNPSVASARGDVSDSFCGTEANHAWKLQNEPDQGPAQIVYSDVFRPATVCLGDVQSSGSGFTVSRSTAVKPWTAYPNIGQGDQWGIRPPGTWLPYQPGADGMPVASVVTNAVQNQGNHNAAFDLWFNRTRNAWVGQNNGAEIMIWTDCHDTCFRWYNSYVTIDNIRWGVREWTSQQAGPSDTGVTWLYTAYVALTPRDSVSEFYLNPFLRNAEANHRLNASWWLTGADYGFEIGPGSAGLYVRDYSLTGFGPVWTATDRRTARARVSARATATVTESATVKIGPHQFTESATATDTESAGGSGTGTATVIGHGLNEPLAQKAARGLAAGSAAEKTALNRAEASARAAADRAAMASARRVAGNRALILARRRALMSAAAYFLRHRVTQRPGVVRG